MIALMMKVGLDLIVFYLYSYTYRGALVVLVMATPPMQLLIVPVHELVTTHDR